MTWQTVLFAYIRSCVDGVSIQSVTDNVGIETEEEHNNHEAAVLDGTADGPAGGPW